MLCCLYLGPQMITLKRNCRPFLKTHGGCFLSVQEFLEFFLGMCFSVIVGIKFNIKSKEAGVCINLQMYASHLCISRLHIYMHYICLYTQVNIKRWWQKSKKKYFVLLYPILCAFLSPSLSNVIERRVTTVIPENYKTGNTFKVLHMPVRCAPIVLGLWNVY